MRDLTIPFQVDNLPRKIAVVFCHDGEARHRSKICVELADAAEEQEYMDREFPSCAPHYMEPYQNKRVGNYLKGDKRKK